MRRAGARARVTVVAYDSTEPFLVERHYARVFEQLGASNVSILPISSRETARSAEAVRAVEASDGVFFPGGNQSSITGYIGGTELHAALRRRVEEGMVLGGTSAGAAMMPEIMIAKGDD